MGGGVAVEDPAVGVVEFERACLSSLMVHLQHQNGNWMTGRAIAAHKVVKKTFTTTWHTLVVVA